MREHEYIIGFDMDEYDSQISYYDFEKQEPESVEEEEEETFLLANVLFFDYKCKKWYSGKKADESFPVSDGYLEEHLFQKLSKGDNIIVGDNTFSPIELLCILVETHLGHLIEKDDLCNIKNLVFTTDIHTLLGCRFIKELSKRTGLPEACISITGRTNSLLNFVFHQDSAIYSKSVCLFDFSQKGLSYYQIDVDQKRKNGLIQVETKDFTKELPGESLLLEPNELDQSFMKIVKEVTLNQKISTVYLTGFGFLKQWLSQSLTVLCSGRRAFIGQNIYAKGACFAAMDLWEKKEDGGPFIVAKDFMIHDIGIAAYKAGVEELIPIVKAGKEWFNTNGSIEVYLDSTLQLELIYHNQYTGAIKKDTIPIIDLPSRPAKASKLQLSICMESSSKGYLVIRDRGFGMLYEATNKIYRNEFTLT